jgi:tetratricopeptide (TPR) repeat protein
VAAEPDAPDVPEIRASARETLARAGQAAISLALGPEARRYFEHAAELAEDDSERAGLLEQAGRAARMDADTVHAEPLLREAIALFERAGDRRAAAPAAVVLADVLFRERRTAEATALLEEIHAALGGERGDALEAEVAAWLARVRMVSGDLDGAGPLLESALDVAENQQAWPTLADALITRCVYLIFRGRKEEGRAVLKHALVLAREHGPAAAAMRAYFNLAATHIESDRYADAVAEVDRGLEFARERGDRGAERQLHSQKLVPLVRLGRWDEAVGIGEALLAVNATDEDGIFGIWQLVAVLAARGDEGGVQRCVELAASASYPDGGSEDAQSNASLTAALAARLGGAPAEALEIARPIIGQTALAMETIEDAYIEATEAAWAARDDAAAEELIAFAAELPPVRATPLLSAQRHRLAARLAAARGAGEVADGHERDAIALLRGIEVPFLLAQTLLQRGERLAPADAAPLLREAREIFERLGAAPWAERAAAGAPAAAV